MRLLCFHWIDVLQFIGTAITFLVMVYRLLRPRANFWSAIFIVLALPLFAAVPFAFSSDSFATTAFLSLRNVGFAALLAGSYLSLKKGLGKILIVPGLLALITFVGVLFFSGAFNLFTNGSGLTSAFSSAATTKTDAKSVSLLVELGPDDSIDEISALLEESGATFEQAFPRVTPDEDADLAQYYLIECPANAVENLSKALKLDKENIDGVELNEEIRFFKPLVGTNRTPGETQFFANDPQLNQQWSLAQSFDLHKLLSQLKPAKKAVVAIIDTGVDGGHEDVSDVFVSDSPGAEDKNGHGSHCAGLAGAVTNNGLGIASLNWEGKFIRVAGYKALQNNGGGTIESVAEAIIAAAEDGADVISLSLGGYHPTPPKAETDAIEYALKLGAIVVVAAGNDGDDARNYAPANIPGVISVAATDAEGKPASFTNQNAGLGAALSAPGVDMLSLKAGGGYVSMSGTSMATPYVAGLFGVMRALNPKITAQEAYRAVVTNGDFVSNGLGKKVNPLQTLKPFARAL